MAAGDARRAVRKATSGRLTAKERQDQTKAVERRKVAAKRRGKPLTRAQIAKAQLDMKQTLIRRRKK